MPGWRSLTQTSPAISRSFLPRTCGRLLSTFRAAGPAAWHATQRGSYHASERHQMDLIDRIDALIAERHLLKHPFYVKWRDGTLPTESIQEYARQYYAFESTFPRLLSNLHSRSDRADVRQSLLDNLWDEE